MSACCQSNAKQNNIHKNNKLQQAHLSININLKSAMKAVQDTLTFYSVGTLEFSAGKEGKKSGIGYRI